MNQTVFNDGYVTVQTGGATVDWFFADRINNNGGPLDTPTNMFLGSGTVLG